MASPLLHSFYIFNSSYGPKEGEEIKKVLYYYPQTASVDVKCTDVGLSEAMIKFVETFSDKPCQAIHTLKQRHLYFEPEPGFWIIMKLNIPCKKNAEDGDDYHDEEIHDKVYETVLRQSYEMFKLFMGSFVDILTKAHGDVTSLKQRLEHFYSRYLITLKLSQCDILDVYNGISWLPLDKNMYLRIQCLMNRLQAKYPQIQYTTFLSNDYLVWSGVPQQDMRVLYQYLITSLFPAHYEQEITSSGGVKRNFTNENFGQFITGSAVAAEDSKPSRLPRVYINVDGSLVEFHLLVYRALSATVCALIKGSTSVSLSFRKKFDADLGPSLTELASELLQGYPQKPTGGDMTIKYIYFNHMNLATKTTVHVDARKTRLVNVPLEILSTVTDLNSHLRSSLHDTECMVRTATDYWLVCKKSDSRELYVLISDKNANLTTIDGYTRMELI
ncbi:vacuolar fusion protein CCZ1 homolog isoform X2 [Watersipora subatra]|uniref:vacuolar fusion protein CCZ1 homolog isoform X2 n=1 Tax=Watersipora subatra TaxID=2589382 RepID=UPI00355BD372